MSMHRRALMTGIAVALMFGGWASAAAESSEAKTDKAPRGGRKEAKARAEESPKWDEAETKDRGAGRRGRSGDRRPRGGGPPGAPQGGPQEGRHDGPPMRGGGRFGREQRSEADMKRMRQQIAERIEVLRDIHPETAERLEQHINQRGGNVNPDRLRIVMGERFQRIERLVHLKRDDPDAYKLAVSDMRLDRKTREIADAIRRRGGDNDARSGELRGAITEHFDVRQRKYEHELQRLEKRIAELRRQLETRREHRESLEQSRYDELVATPERPEW